MRSTTGIAAAALMALLVGCANLGVPDDFSGVVGEGGVVSETREVEPFTAVRAGGGIHLQIDVGSEQSVTLSGQQNILDILETEVDDATLVISASDSYSATEEVTATIAVESLDGLDLSGGSVADVRGVDAATLGVTVSGGAELTAEGQASDLHLNASGGARAYLDALEAEDVHIECSGGVQVELAASNTVTGEASGGAIVDVGGDATIDVDVSGGSQVE